MYRAQRNYENVQRMLFDGIGRYDIPEIEPTHFDNAEFIGAKRSRIFVLHDWKQRCDSELG